MMLANQEIKKLYTRIKHANIEESLGLSRNKAYDRSRIIGLIGILIIVVVVLRLIFLNLYQTKFLEQELNSRVFRKINLSAMRGQITDRNGIPLAVSTPVKALWVNPKELTNLNSSNLTKLSKLLNIPISKINQKLNSPHKTFIYLARGVNPEVAQQILNLKIKGLYGLTEYKRYYPYSEVSSSVVGFNSIDDQGMAGIEYTKEHSLSGISGNENLVYDLKRHVVDTDGNIIPAQNGQNITLALNQKIQFIAYNALKDQVNKSQAKGGSAIVLDAKSGEVLAMVNLPTFNPNNRKEFKPDMLLNRAATNVYDPGSIIKPLVIAKALDLGMVKPSTVFDTHPYRVGPKLIVDDHPYPKLTVAEIIQHSSDIGTSKIGILFKARDLWTYFKTLGFGSKLNTGFPGETNGILLNWKRWYPIDQALMSYGYGISVSLFQMAHAYTLFTNNGCLLNVSFTKLTSNNLTCDQIISPKTAKAMQKILAATAIDGTAKSAQTAHYTVAGKTGTAQVLVNGKYSNKTHIGSFVGYAPNINPKIIVAVMIDRPSKGSYYGSQTAAPVFSNIVEGTLHSLKVPEDKADKL